MLVGYAHLQPIVSIIAGILILLIPRLLNYIVAVYLIVIGVIGLGLSTSARPQAGLHHAGSGDFRDRTLHPNSLLIHGKTQSSAREREIENSPSRQSRAQSAGRA